MKFNSRKDLLYTVLLTGVLPLPSFISIFIQPELSMFIIFAACLLLSVYIWKSTFYEISGDYLVARTMFLRTKLKIADIISIRETENILSSYALSFKRLEINVPKKEPIYIAPLDKEGLYKELKTINPDILII